MSLEQVLADHSAALNNLAAAIREQIAAVGKPRNVVVGYDTAVGGPVEKPAPEVKKETKDPETIIVDEQPITGKAEEIQTVAADEQIASEVTYDEMRSAFMKVPSKCGADVAREILAKFSCTKVPQVPAEHYAEVKRLSEEALAKAGK